MTDNSVRAEWEPLDAVRVHTPGIELWSGSLDPGPNLFENHVPPDQARAEHERIVAALEDAGVEVHQLADDLEAAGTLDELVRESVSVRTDDGDEPADVDGILSNFDAREKLQLALARVTMDRHADDPASSDGVPGTDGTGTRSPATSLRIDRPISNVYFQRDTTILGDRGPVLCDMYEPVRQPEIPIVRDAWDGVGAEIHYEMSGEPIEGGEFMPAGEFALLGVSAEIDGEERVIRTSYAAGERLMDDGAVGYDEFGLVRAPLEADRRLRREHDAGSRVMHLLGWFNIAAEGLAVLDADLARAAEIDVYEKRGDTYEFDHSTDTLAYVRDEKGFDVIDISWDERWPTNFLAVDDGVVVPLYEPDETGAYRPENNPTIEALKERGVTVLPDGEGLPRAALTNGAGGIHCMTTPIHRG
ncbi:arginine deiminase family protein [Halorussus amylolyticus]|uniref:arginine deiminase family protein n=1 Tax=Halorussus amylolyticus TaxID=1126242 RepID=UPI001045B10A|nr:arginine deiminase family protein [Halorussus amylolyticus]